MGGTAQMPDRISKARRSWLMSRVRQRDTDIEREVRSALHRRGFRFRKHVKDLPGQPDIVFTRAKVAVFVDGDFWHGYRFDERAKTMKPYWRQKIQGNIERDRRNRRDLEGEGWTVLRVWQHEVRDDLAGILEMIEAAVEDGIG